MVFGPGLARKKVMKMTTSHHSCEFCGSAGKHHRKESSIRRSSFDPTVFSARRNDGLALTLTGPRIPACSTAEKGLRFPYLLGPGQRAFLDREMDEPTCEPKNSQSSLQSASAR
jgi:hypothetical protein